MNLLSKFIEGNTQIFNEENRSNPQVTHYYYEIIRFWSKINFIVRKTLRSLKPSKEVKNFGIEPLFFATYRFMFEKAEISSIKKEIDQDPGINTFLERLKSFSWKIALEGKDKLENLSINESIPSFFIEHLLPIMKFNFLKENIKYMNQYSQQKSITLRVNHLTSKMSVETLIKSIKKDFKEDGIKIRQDKDYPIIVHTNPNNKRYLIFSKYYKNSSLIFQDKGSVAIVKLLRAQPGEFICDLCAAPGIKSSLIAQFSENKSRIVCNDFNYERLRFTRLFLDKMKARGVFFLNSDGTRFPIDSDIKFDKILIDAPCTGSGTFLKNPELKWRQNQAFLQQNVLFQEKLLKTGLDLLKPNGILVYSTCSLYPEEGELQIVKFKERLAPLSLPKWFSPSYKIKNEILKGTGRLFPAIHHTQGFFVGIFKKKGKII